MSVVKKIFVAVLTVAIVVFAPELTGFIVETLHVSTFIASVIGSIVIAVGLGLIQSIFNNRSGTSQEASTYVVRVAEPIRWLCAGLVRQGGAVLFAEFDSAGNLWVLMVHSDSILTGTTQYYLDDIPVTLDGSNYVRQKEFRLQTNKEKDPATADDQGLGYVQIWTTTYSETDPVPARISTFDSAWPTKWTSDHKLVGTTFSVMKMRALPIEHRHKIYKWRGSLGMGEPALSVLGDWSNMYDPREVGHVLGDRTTYEPTRNAALIWAWFRTHKYGRKKSESSIDWTELAAAANVCDENVVGLYGTVPRYVCGIAIPDDKKRSVAEFEILLTMDGQLMFGDDGKSWCNPGKYYAPTLSFSRNRDIMAMETVEPQNGESETQGVVVRYVEPDADYTVQPSAAWLNPNFYDPATAPNLLTVDILACHDHNQAQRLAKAIGMRSQPIHKLGPTVNLRGLQARQERIVAVNYDNTFAGDYEIAIPVEVDAAGMFCSFGAVPVDANRWDMETGEEQEKPTIDGSASTPTYGAITGESLSYDGIAIVIDFPTLARDDTRYVAQYILTSDITPADTDPWIAMTINENQATSGFVLEGVEYTVRYRYLTASGQGPSWETDTITPGITLSPPTNFAATDGTGQVTLDWRNSTDARFLYSRIYRHTSDDFGSSSDISGQIYGGLGVFDSYVDTVAAGTYYYWIVAYDASANPSTEVGSVVGVSS